jgi:hypothetical protein
MEYLESTPNQNTVDTEPPLLQVFKGKYGLYMMIGVLAFILINSAVSRVLSPALSTLISASPTLFLTFYVVVLVNGKLPHYKDDLFLVGLFHFLAFLYLRGWIKRPPQLWRKIKKQEPVV